MAAQDPEEQNLKQRIMKKQETGTGTTTENDAST